MDDWDAKHKFESMNDSCLSVYSVGFVVFESDDRMILLQHDGDKEWACAITIPKVSIIQRVKMERVSNQADPPFE